MDKKAHLRAIIAIGAILLVVLGACSSPAPGTLIDGNNCTDLVITSDSVLVSPGDASGVRTSAFEIFAQSEETPAMVRYVDVALYSNGVLLDEKTNLPVIGQLSGVEIAILPDMDPALLVDYPAHGDSNTNKRYYFRDIIDAFVDSTAIGKEEPLVSNTALVAKPSGATERMVTANETYNLLLRLLPEISSMDDRSVVIDRVRRQLRDWSLRPGSKPRLIVIFRLQTTPANTSTYQDVVDSFDPLSTFPTVVVDIGHSGETIREGRLTIIPLGDPPRRFDASDWPPSQDWQDRMEEINGRLGETIPGVVQNMSQVFSVPELSWKIPFNNEQAQGAAIRVSTQSTSVGRSVCVKPLDFPSEPRNDSRSFLGAQGLVLVLTGLASALILFIRKSD